jgi:hypothetical protein
VLAQPIQDMSVVSITQRRWESVCHVCGAEQ